MNQKVYITWFFAVLLASCIEHEPPVRVELERSGFTLTSGTGGGAEVKFSSLDDAGSDAATFALPDLRINRESAAASLWLAHQEFGENSCELEEQCVSGSGRRRLLRFEGRIENWGPGDLTTGLPRSNPLFEYSACHNHFHFRDFTDYRVLDAQGNLIAQGHKQSYCLVDMQPVDSPSMPAPPGTRPASDSEAHIDEADAPSECNHLSAGWADIYGVDTPCQWVDVTGVAPGDYILLLSVNPLGRIAETTFENNTVRLPVHIPADASCAPQPELCGDAVDQDCDALPDAWDRDCAEPAAPEPAAHAPPSCRHDLDRR